jgi:glycosidase
MGSTNHDIFRWPAMVNGTMKEAFASYIGMLLIPGTPLVYYGQEQGLCGYQPVQIVSSRLALSDAETFLVLTSLCSTRRVR